MKNFKQFFKENTEKDFLYDVEVYHSSNIKFESPFAEDKIGTANDEGYSGRGFYFFPNKEDAKFAAPKGWVRPFKIYLKNPINLDDNDLFSEEPPEGMTYNEYRDQITLKMLKEGYDGSYRTMNGRIEEICVFSFKAKGFDGNKLIVPNGEWEKVNN